MDTKTAIKTLVNHLKADMAVPVRVSGMEDERPVPVVLISDWDITDYTYHNTAFAGQEVDPTDDVEKQWYRFYYDMRIEITVRYSDEVAAHSLLDDLRSSLRMVGEDPLSFHEHLNDLMLRGSSGIDHQFLESTETELNQSIVLKTFNESTTPASQYTTIDSFVNNIDIIP
ncbi:hypothetical protein [Halomonas sp.]|uniref:hypothetical protein n=1 Tax=Halomonas sp. TaxID=1486246 RepID=UPI003565E709